MEDFMEGNASTSCTTRENKEKAQKSDKTRRAQPNVSRTPARPPPHPPNQEQAHEPAPPSIFGSLRRLKAGVATSTPKKPATFYADLEANQDKKINKDLGIKSSKKRVKKDVTEVAGTRRVDNNGNVTSEPSTNGYEINSQIVIRRRGKENVQKDFVDSSRRPESKRVVPTSRTAALSKDKAKASTLSLHTLLRNQPKAPQSQPSKPKRPVTLAVPSNVSVRRGHKEGQGHPDNISRTSSITNLDSLEANIQTQGKGAKPRKAASKERIDKQGQDGKKVTKNNNKLEPPPPAAGQPLSYSSDSLQEVELHQLRKQLREMADEKSSLALQLGEQRGQLNVLQKEILKLKSFQDESNVEMEKLAEENTALRNRLRDVAHSPLSDNEKQQLLFEGRHHSSAPASIATNVADDNGGDATTCTTPDWDKHSSGNVSEVSVACLQDKINQMQETHYSTNEELQATLQELTDLQRQLTELQQENERLNEEKTLMFDSLCRQTERLNDSRQEVENIKQLFYRDRSNENGQLESVVEREQQLVELLRSAQEEREQLLLKLEQIQAELHEARSGNIEKTENITQLSERVRTLECTLDAKHAEHKQLDQELAQAKDQCSGKQIEINRLSDLLENARTKINELEQDRALSDKSELDEMLDNARKEKDQLESEVAYLKEQLARSKNEIEKLKEQVFVLQEECKVTRNNAKTTQSDLEYKCEKLVTEKNTLGEQLQQFQEAVNELQVQAQCHLEDKRQLSAVLSETQRNMSEAERKNMNLENELQELRKLRAEENDEWQKFQNDLLTSVRVANDFKTEAQQELQKIILENKTYRERVRLLEGQVEKLKGEKTSTSTQTDVILTPQILALAKNLDPSVTNRLSLLEHLSATDPGSHPSSPTGNMDKLFPILSRDRKSKSKENLADISSRRSSESSSRRHKDKEGSEKAKSIPKNIEGNSLKKSKSRDDLTQYCPQPIEEQKIENKSFLKRNKSKDNLQDTNEIDSKDKGSRSFLKWNRSKVNLENLSGEEIPLPPKEKKGFFKRNKSQENLDQMPETSPQPRESKASIESSSDSNKSDPKPEFFSKFIKKREKKPTNRSKFTSHPKFISVEEEMLLKSLDNWYKNIDQNMPDEFLSEEDRAVRKLKTLYEDDMLKEKPMAHKAKEHLAISKPLLNSVVRNPKLEQICRDHNLPIVDSEIRLSALEDVCSLIIDQKEGSPKSRMKSENIYTNIGPPHMGIHKSKSLEDVNVFEEYRTDSELAPVLYKTAETQHLDTEEHLAIRTVSYTSEIQPNDSVSNPRYSTRYHMTNSDLPKPNIYINYENLDEIVDKIPKTVPDSKLTDEQKFALKLKQALDDAEKKTTLKKMKKKKRSIKGLEISVPTQESVEKNWKLKEIILNPGIKKAQEPGRLSRGNDNEWKRHSTDICSDLGSPQEIPKSQGFINSKSYEDISFSFVPENTLLNLYYAEQIRVSKFTTGSTSSSSPSFTSAEFNLDTGKITQKCDVPIQYHQVDSVNGDVKEDLLYNETINKVKDKEKRQSIEELKKELSKQETHNNLVNEKISKETAADVEGVVVVVKEAINDFVKHEDDLSSTTDHDIEYSNAQFKVNDNSFQIAEFKNSRGSVEIEEATSHNSQVIENSMKKSRHSLDGNQRFSGSSIQTGERSSGMFNINFDGPSSSDYNANLLFNTEPHSEFRNVEGVKSASDGILRAQKLILEDINYQFPSLKPAYESLDISQRCNETMASCSIVADSGETQKMALEKVEYQSPSAISANKENITYTESVNSYISPTESIQYEPQNYQKSSLLHQPIDDIITDLQIEPSIPPSYNSGSLETYQQEYWTQEADGSIRQTVEVTDSYSYQQILRDKPENAQDEAKNIKKLAAKNMDDQLPSGNSTQNETIYIREPVDVTSELQIESLETDQQIDGLSSKIAEETEGNNHNQTENLDYPLPSTNITQEEILNSDNSNETNQQQHWTQEVDALVPQTAEVAESYGHQQLLKYKPENAQDEAENIKKLAVKNIDDQLPSRNSTQNETIYIREPVDVTSELQIESLETDQQIGGLISKIAEETEGSDHIQTENLDYPLPSTNITQEEILNSDNSNETNQQEYWTQEVDAPIPQTAEVAESYGYKQILKENQYGVVSPLDLRYTYRTVVKEYKNKYHQDEEHEESERGSDQSDLEYNEDCIDEFFKPVFAFEDSNIEQIIDEDVTAPKSQAISQIDQEMDEIMDKYLHTRASLLVKKIGDEKNDKELEQKSNLKKYDNFEDLQKVGNKELEVSDDIEGKQIPKPAIVLEYDEETKTLNLDDSQDDDNAPLSLQDLQFIQEMKSKYASVDTISTSSDHSVDHLVTEAEVDEKGVLLRPPKNRKSERPLSEINQNDLFLIEQITRKTFVTENEPSLESDVVIEELNNDNVNTNIENSAEEVPQVSESFIDSAISPDDQTSVKKIPVSMIPKRKDTSLHYLSPSLRPKKPVDPPLHPPPKSPQPDTNVVFRRNHTSQESSHSPRTNDHSNSKRLSELMFNETIFVPISQSSDSPGSPRFKQDNAFKESVFVSSPSSTQKNLELNPTFSSKIPTWKRNTVSTTPVEESTISISKEQESPSVRSTKSEVKVSFNKYSTIPQPKTSPNNQRTSWSDSLKKGLMDIPISTYKPVYFDRSKPQLVPIKPLPRPRESSFRNEHLAGRNVINVTFRSDSFDNMNDPNENFSEPGDNTLAKGEIQENKAVIDVLSQGVILVEESRAQTDILREQLVTPTEITKNDEPYKHEDNITTTTLKIMDNNIPSTASSSKTTIDDKMEHLNISESSPASSSAETENVEEIPRRSDIQDSNVNLFHLGSNSSYDSYLELFKSKESKDFDNLRGKKPHHAKDFFGGGFAYVEEILIEDAGSVNTLDSLDTEVKPRIVNFVPLDDKTTPVFTKPTVSYDTLEREKTFHVLEQAANISDNKTEEIIQEKEDPKPPTTNVKPETNPVLENSLEVLARNSSSFSKSSSKSQTNTGSRTSFTQAKKLFEALAEANKEERPKSAMNPKHSSRFSVKDSKSLAHVKPSKEGMSETGCAPKPAKDWK